MNQNVFTVESKFIEKQVSESIVGVFKDCKHSEIAYSLTLQVIKERLKNMFYRRKESVINDINCLKTNCKLYVNKNYLKTAEEFVDLILLIANDSDACYEEQYITYLNKYKHLTQTEPQVIPHSSILAIPPIVVIPQLEILTTHTILKDQFQRFRKST